MRQPKKAFIIFLAVVAIAAMIAGPCSYLGFKVRRAFGAKVVKEFRLSSPENAVGWEQKELAPKKTDYMPSEFAGKKCYKGVADDSASAFYFREKLDFNNGPFVSWDWIVETFPTRRGEEALDKKSEFDFAAQFYVIFYSRFFLKTRAIQYVWTESVPVGTSCDSPYTPNVKILVLQSGRSETWKHEERDISADYSTLFGEPLDKDVVAVSFMTDADSTGSSAAAYYSDVKIGYLGRESGQEPPAAELLRRAIDRFKGKEQPSST